MSVVLRVDFFQPDCQTGPHTDVTFGICDPEEGFPQVDRVHFDDWVATIDNPKAVPITFTAIDGCVFEKDKPPQRCDAMLTTANSIHLVELKNRKRPKIAAAAGRQQLIATIEALKAEPGIAAQFKVRKAHVCNKRQPNYQSEVSERDFKLTYGFSLHHRALIEITE